MTKTQQERRGAQRMPAAADITVRHMRRQLLGRARDISENGIFLLTDSGIEKGADIEVILRMPAEFRSRGGRWVSCLARVVRVESEGPDREFGIAARITHCEPVDIVG